MTGKAQELFLEAHEKRLQKAHADKNAAEAEKKRLEQDAHDQRQQIADAEKNVVEDEKKRLEEAAQYTAKMDERQKDRSLRLLAEKAQIDRLKKLKKRGARKLSHLIQKHKDVKLKAMQIAQEHVKLEEQGKELCTQITDLEKRLSAAEVKQRELSHEPRRGGSVYQAKKTFSKGV